MGLDSRPRSLRIAGLEKPEGKYLRIKEKQMSNGAPDQSGLPPAVIPHQFAPWLAAIAGIAGTLYGVLPSYTIAGKASGIIGMIAGVLLGLSPGARKAP